MRSANAGPRVQARTEMHCCSALMMMSSIWLLMLFIASTNVLSVACGDARETGTVSAHAFRNRGMNDAAIVSTVVKSVAAFWQLKHHTRSSQNGNAHHNSWETQASAIRTTVAEGAESSRRTASVVGRSNENTDSSMGRVNVGISDTVTIKFTTCIQEVA